MAAFFRNTTQKAMDGNIPDTPPIIVVPRAEDRDRVGSSSARGTPAARAAWTSAARQRRADFDNGCAGRRDSDSRRRSCRRARCACSAARSGRTARVAVTWTRQRGIAGETALGRPQACDSSEKASSSSSPTSSCRGTNRSRSRLGPIADGR